MTLPKVTYPRVSEHYLRDIMRATVNQGMSQESIRTFYPFHKYLIY